MTSENFLIIIKILLFDMVFEASTHIQNINIKHKKKRFQTRRNECVVEKEKLKLAFNKFSRGFITKMLYPWIYCKIY